MPLILFFLFVAAAVPGVICFRAGEWCLSRQRQGLRILVFLVLIALGIGTAYGLLRLTGIIVLPGDNTYSVNYFNASWQDDGVRRIVTRGGPFAGVAAALILERKNGKSSPDSKIEGKS